MSRCDVRIVKVELREGRGKTNRYFLWCNRTLGKFIAPYSTYKYPYLRRNLQNLASCDNLFVSKIVPNFGFLIPKSEYFVPFI